MESILVVDDEKSIRITIAEFLRDRRYEVHLAEDALVALEILRKHPVDLVISDIMMPEMRGTDLLEVIRSEYPEIKTILITGQASLENATESLRGGAFDYLEKPVLKHTLLSVIENAFRVINLNRLNARLLAENQQYREKLEDLVHSKTAYLTRLSQRIVTVQDEERNRIAEEIDRTIGQSLFALKLDLQAELARRPDTEGEHTIAYLDEIIARTRTMAETLNPIGLSGTDLGIALHRIVEEFVTRTGARVELAMKALPPMPGAETTSMACLVVREALANALHHGKAGLIRVEVEPEGNCLSIGIDDNGEGFRLLPRNPETDSGIGILLMQERAAALGGNLTIRSEPGKGTSVLLTFPVEPGTS